MKKLSIICVATATLLFLYGCTGKDNWGIDQSNRNQSLLHCTNNSHDASIADALIVPAGTKIEKLTDDTVLRIWHAQNSKKAVCVIEGDAIIVGGIK